MMKEAFMAALAACMVMAFQTAVISAEAPAGKTGEELFREHCVLCHPDGGNIVNPQKTLLRAHREAHGIRTAADIVRIMRNPGPGMQKFDRKTLPDPEAKKIAEYILKTFK